MKTENNEIHRTRFIVRDLSPGSILFLLFVIGYILYSLVDRKPDENRNGSFFLGILLLILIATVAKTIIGQEIIRLDDDKLIQQKFPFLKTNTREYHLNKIQGLKVEEFESSESWRLLFGAVGPRVFKTKYKLAFKYNETEVQIGVGMNYKSCNKLKELIIGRKTKFISKAPA